jgi:hypothetical protein
MEEGLLCKQEVGSSNLPVSTKNLRGKEMKPGTIVKSKANGILGVICHDLPSYLRCGDPGDITVQFAGSAGTLELPPDEVEIIGEESPIPDHDKCGGGKGANCCIFLILDGDGFHCERHGELRWSLIFSTMTAKRVPGEFYPDCMNQ